MTEVEKLQSVDSAAWADHYLEPHTGTLYRMDSRSNWYDVAGVRLAIPVFLYGDVLISLPKKTSRKSYNFRGATLLVSPRVQLVQIGRMVYDTSLTPVQYFGERLAGLGPRHLDFGGKDTWQEVLISINHSAFIHEYSGVPLVIENEEIIAYEGSVKQGGQRYHQFSSATRTYVTGDRLEDLFRVEGEAVEMDFTSFARLNKQNVALTRVQGTWIYIDLETRSRLTLAGLEEEAIHEITPITFPGRQLYRIRCGEKKRVYDLARESVLTIDGRQLWPEDLEVHPYFSKHLFIVSIGTDKYVCRQRSGEVLKLGPEDRAISHVEGKSGDRLLNSRTRFDEEVVLDAGFGMDKLAGAQVAGDAVLKTIGEPKRVGGLTLQQALIHRVGGPIPRMLVISNTELSVFTLPTNMTAYDDQAGASIFAGSEIVAVDFEAPVNIEGDLFYPAKFLLYDGSEEDVIIDAANGRPLHLDGAGHRNELVTNLDVGSINARHLLGSHRMIGAITLTEDNKRGELLFSLEDRRSWLPFYDNYLPIFRRVVRPTAAEKNWGYDLYELRESGGAEEYLVVEKIAPHRMLVLRMDGRYIPRVITRKDRALQHPETINQVRKFFLSSGELVEIL